MNLRISSITKAPGCITITMCDQGDYDLIDISAIFLMAVESGVKQILCIGESISQAKAIAKLATSLKPFGISVVINTIYTSDEITAKARRGKYVRVLLDCELRCS